ncbi:MAG: class I SAM-dependent methyltransferase [Hydrogenophaga sp.]|uniref:class I SAM-dependent methyltransferase n=1 Tax=Hydrogenophaga sp. TaxID=1904254 RepID=UPI002723AC56|nr:class I SAM-dependent methyltransferase [Hydrogenophaga sp.]MDO9147628.1 class I SAM-dependent methyltransferase [Hydrogenophaga sp.]MDO9606377.1 class I SAM-dependent methyltransferase [Hydrogenophaga sp.]
MPLTSAPACVESPSLPHAHPLIHWTTPDGVPASARWRSERGAPAPQRVVLADDTITADAAYRLACAGTAMLWQGDFHNARQLLQAMARRCDTTPARKHRKAARPADAHSAVPTGADAFHKHRQTQSQRARILGMLLLRFEPDHTLALRRAPDVQLACTHAWGAAALNGGDSVASMRELLGLTSAQEWRRVGVEVPALGSGPNNRVFPHYGVFSPVRGEYIDLVAQAPLPVAPSGQASAATQPVFDIGTGTGVLSAVLARRGVGPVTATDLDPRALACAHANLSQLGVRDCVTLLQTDLFPPGQALLVVCNPPWLPARASSPVEHAVYDEGSRMLKGFLNGLAAHLAPGGEGWLILSDLAEHLGLRSRAELLAWIEHAGLTVLGRLDVRPRHSKASNARDPLHSARSAEVTSLWRLGVTRG